MTRWLIVNADDFGLGRGINRGIVEAHLHGIVTSASLMVTTPWSEHAAVMAGEVPGLGIGLHADLGRGAGPEWNATRCTVELRRQLQLLRAMTGRRPTHLDSHHNRHRDPRLTGAFELVAREQGIPLREHSPARYVSSFYGQWGGESHPAQVGVAALIGMLDAEVGEGVTEIACHPGHRDDDIHSGYAAERELELRTLCDPAVAEALRARGIRLASFRELWELEPAAIGETA